MLNPLPVIVDAHQDLAWNMLTFGRDYTRPVAETRRLELGQPVITANDDTLLGRSEYLRGRVAVVFATLFATPERLCSSIWDGVCYCSDDDAHQVYRKQLGMYERLSDEHPDMFRLIRSRSDLEQILAAWETYQPPEEDVESAGSPLAGPPTGLVLLMENAEAVRHPDELEEWRQLGLHIIGPAWAGTRYCGGTREPGPLTTEGYRLLEGMAALNFALDLSHMDQQAALQALDTYPGMLFASHSNAQALLKGYEGNRHLPDRVLRGVLERDGMVGVVPFNAFLKGGWRKGDRREEVGIDVVVAQIDYICQMAGDARHVGFGTDFDGGFGLQSVPAGIDSVADLQNVGVQLLEKGYSPEDVRAILGGSWLSRLRRLLPERL